MISGLSNAVSRDRSSRWAWVTVIAVVSLVAASLGAYGRVAPAQAAAGESLVAGHQGALDLADRPVVPRHAPTLLRHSGPLKGLHLGFRQVRHPDGSLTCKNVMRLVPVKSKPCRVRPPVQRGLTANAALAGPTVTLTADVTTYVALNAATDTPLASGQYLAIYEPNYRGAVTRLAQTATSTTVSANRTPRDDSGVFLAVVTQGLPKDTLDMTQVIAQSSQVSTPSWSLGRAGEDSLQTNYTLSAPGVVGDAQVALWVADRGVQSSMCGGGGTTCTAYSAAGPCTMLGFVAGGSWTQMMPPEGDFYGAATSWPCDLPSNDNLLTMLIDCFLSCDSGDPVDTASGNFHESFTDISLRGRGPGLAMTRYYRSSRAKVEGWFGFGWSSTYEAHLDISSSFPTFTFIDGRGGSTTFVKMPSGRILSPDNVHASLTQDGNGNYLLSDWRARLTWKFDSSGVLQRVIDANGEWVDLAYTAGKLSTVTDRSGRALTFTWSGNRVVKVTDPMGRFASYGYDAGGDLTSVTGMSGLAATNSYLVTSNGYHLLTKRLMGGGGYVRNDYNSVSRAVKDQYILKTAGGTERHRSFTYSGDNSDKTAGGSTTVTDDHGVVTKYSYKRMRLTSVTSAVGTTSEATSSYDYHPLLLRPASITSPTGKTTSYEYDGLGDVIKVTDPMGRISQTTYNGVGQPTCAVNPYQYGQGVRCPTSGSVPLGAAGYAYDGSGNLQSATDAEGNTTTFYRDSTTNPGDVTRAVDAEGRTRTLTYDSYGNVATSSVSPATGVTLTRQRAYNADSRLTCAVSPRQYALGVRCPAPGAAVPSGASGITYDAKGRISSTVNPKGASTSYTYDADNNVTQVTDSRGTTQTAYDLAGRPTSVTTGFGTTAALQTSYAYDIATGTSCDPAVVATATWCSTVTDNASKVTTYYYTPRGMLAGWKLAGGQTRTTAYRADDLPSVITLVGGATVTLDYFADGRIKSQTSSSAAVSPISYTYRDDGARLSMTDGTGTTSYAYDRVGRMTSVTDAASQSVGYAYDKTGRVKTITYPSGRVVTRGYDQAGRWTTVNDGAGHTTTFTLDGDGAVSNIAYASGNQFAITRDNLGGMLTGSLTSPTGTSLAGFTWTRNTFSVVTGETGTGAVAQTPAPTYAYDASLRMKTASGSAYTFDTGDHLTGLGGPTQTFTSDGVGRLATSTNGTVKRSYGYAAGNLTSSTVTAGSGPKLVLAWDGLNRMTSATVTPAGGSATAYTYGYDGDGVRVSRTTAGVTTRFVYSRLGQLPQLLVEGSREYVYGPDGQPIEQLNTDNTSLGYFVHDQHGDTRVLMGVAGAVTAAYRYSPYGVPTRTSGSASSALLYGMGHYDSETGYVYLISRYYDPATGQFLSIDPLVASTGDAYGYADAPLAAVDPLGLECWYNPMTWSWQTWAEIGLMIAAPYLMEFAVGFIGFELAADAGIGLAEGGEALGFLEEGIGALRGESLLGDAANTERGLVEGEQYVYRVHGGESGQWGHSWTPENPMGMVNPRSELGLPKVNSGQMLTRARVRSMDGVIKRDALPLDGNPGGAPEWLFPDPMSQLEHHWTIPLVPPW